MVDASGVLLVWQRHSRRSETFDNEDHVSADAAAARSGIILELGKEALDENETRIRRHRERPLEPLVGG